jgi:hypothetical protein
VNYALSLALREAAKIWVFQKSAPYLIKLEPVQVMREAETWRLQRLFEAV